MSGTYGKAPNEKGLNSPLAKETNEKDGRFLEGQLLVAMPGMVDQRFAKSVIYLCAHSEEGAMGIILNQAYQVQNFPDLLVQLQIIAEQDRILLPPRAENLPVLFGGPVQTDRGFILHTPDFHLDQTTMTIDESVSLTATIDILRAIAAGDGPDLAIMALGYAGWDAGHSAR
jgi:putative transcriptional regulator